jgi:hypothetical protein
LNVAWLERLARTDWAVNNWLSACIVVVDLTTNPYEPSYYHHTTGEARTGRVFRMVRSSVKDRDTKRTYVRCEAGGVEWSEDRIVRTASRRCLWLRLRFGVRRTHVPAHFKIRKHAKGWYVCPAGLHEYPLPAEP